MPLEPDSATPAGQQRSRGVVIVSILVSLIAAWFATASMQHANAVANARHEVLYLEPQEVATLMWGDDFSNVPLHMPGDTYDKPGFYVAWSLDQPGIVLIDSAVTYGTVIPADKISWNIVPEDTRQVATFVLQDSRDAFFDPQITWQTWDYPLYGKPELEPYGTTAWYEIQRDGPAYFIWLKLDRVVITLSAADKERFTKTN